MYSPKAWAFIGLLMTGAFLVSGCSNNGLPPTGLSPGSSSPSTSAPATTLQVTNAQKPSQDVEEHGHKSGAHGGILVSLGRDSYHVEAVFDNGGRLRLYTLGKEESRVIDVENQTLKGFVKVEGDASAQPFLLESEPQDGDPAGRTSQFVGSLPQGLSGQNLEVTIPNIAISGERFRLGFKSTAQSHDEGMPSKLADDEERLLYLTPGGKYTAEDIAANGGVTATVKFKGLKSSHNMFPQSGDLICPVTETKANPIFTWVVGGKSYQFCCPPCVDEFVKAAKTSTEELKLPADYVKP